MPAAIAWTLLFVAVLAHMPALRGFFAQDDWSLLARGAGEVPITGWIARPLGSFFYWRALWPLFGAQAPGYHGTALLLAALMALLAARVAVRLGLSSLGAAVSGLVVAASPLVLMPIFWVAASQELLAVVCALLAIETWLIGGRWRLLALVAAFASFASKEGALGLPLWLYLLALLRGPALGRLGRAGLGLMAMAAALSASTVLRAIPHAAGDPYELGGLAVIARNLGLLGGWLLAPAPLSSDAPLLLALGAALWLGWCVAAAWFWRRGGDSLPLLALAWALLAIAPVVALRGHLYPYYLCSALIGWSWLLGWTAERLLPARWRAREGKTPASVVFAAGAAFCTVFAWTTSQAHLRARGEDGLHADPIVRRSAIAADAKRQIQRLPLLPGGHLTVLQATRSRLAAAVEDEVLVGSPVFQALQGPIGLARIVPEQIRVDWSSHLDDTPLTAQVLLDDGSPQLRVLGDTANARLYSAMIAIGAGQYARARHDLWNVVGPLGSEVRWAYDSDALPIDPASVKANARAFVAHLVAEPSPANGRILRIFEQMYEAVTGDAMIQPPWGKPIRG